MSIDRNYIFDFLIRGFGLKWPLEKKNAASLATRRVKESIN
jgi:hypothetical protein